MSDASRVSKEQQAAIDAALEQAVQDALWRHKQAGNPICVWRDGQVVWIPPDEIPVERPPSSPAAADPLAGEGL